MAPKAALKTQLDPLIGVLETREEAVRLRHAEAAAALAAAREREEAARSLLAAEQSTGSTAGDLRASELRLERWRRELSLRQGETRAAAQELEARREALAQAHRKTETMRRASERIRVGLVRALGKAEEKEQDELALLAYGRRQRK